MPKYVAFLRGINVGGRKINMADLKMSFDSMGFKDVETLLNTGNVIFLTDKNQTSLKNLIEINLTKTFNYRAKVQVYGIDVLKKVINNYPFGVASLKEHDYVIFLENGLERTVVNEKLDLAFDEKIKAGEGVVYWRVSKGSTLQSSFGKLLTRSAYKEFNTNRNLNTLKKILNL